MSGMETAIEELAKIVPKVLEPTKKEIAAKISLTGIAMLLFGFGVDQYSAGDKQLAVVLWVLGLIAVALRELTKMMEKKAVVTTPPVAEEKNPEEPKKIAKPTKKVIKNPVVEEKPKEEDVNKMLDDALKGDDKKDDEDDPDDA